MQKLISSYWHLVRSWLRYGSCRKALNLSKIAFSYAFSTVFKINKHSAMPFFISVEPANFCQLQCPECPVGASKRNSGNTFYLTVFEKLVNELKSTLFHMQFYFQGEPLLNKLTPQLISIAHQAQIYTSISTNAQLLNEKTAKELVLSGLDKIIISIDGATQDVYEKYRVGGKLKLALEGVEWINYWKNELQSLTPYVEMQFVVFKTNEHQLVEIKKISQKYHVDKLRFKSAQIYNLSQGDELLTTITKYARYKRQVDGSYALKNKLHNRCYRLWSGAVVDVNGNLLPCCFDKDNSHSYGNVSEQDFKSVYQNHQAKTFRKSILENRSQYAMCCNCTSK